MKVLIRIGIVVLFLLLVVLIIVMFQLGALLKKGVEIFGPQFTGATVTLERAIVRPFSGKVVLKGLNIGNPEEYKTPSVMRLISFTADLDMRSLKKDTIIIEEVLIEGPEIIFEMKSLGQNNIKSIIQNAQLSSFQKKEKSSTGTKGLPPKKVVIKKLVVSNGKLHLSSSLVTGTPLNFILPTILLQGIGEKSEGVSAPEAIILILEKILEETKKTIAGSTELTSIGVNILLNSAIKTMSAPENTKAPTLNTIQDIIPTGDTTTKASKLTSTGETTIYNVLGSKKIIRQKYKKSGGKYRSTAKRKSF